MSELSANKRMLRKTIFNKAVLSTMIPIMLLLTAFFLSNSVNAEDGKVFSIVESKDKGVFKRGDGQGSIRTSIDQSLGKKVMEFNFSAPNGAVVGVWAEGFPAGMSKTSVDAVNIGVRLEDANQAGDILVRLELNGKKDKQYIPLKLGSGWNQLKNPIDWKKIGALKDIAVIVVPVSSGNSIDGKLYFNVEFYKMTAEEKKEIAEAQAIRNKNKAAQSYLLLNARRIDPFNMGLALAGKYLVFDDTIKKKVVQLDFSFLENAVLGLATSEYPPEMGRETVDAFEVGVFVPDQELADKIKIKMEIKGFKTKDAKELSQQNIILPSRAGWNYVKNYIDWGNIGKLQEITFVVTPAVVGEKFEGKINFDAKFYKIGAAQKNFMFTKIGLVVLLALIGALILNLMGALFGRNRASKADMIEDDSAVTRLKRDFLYGIVAFLVMWSALKIFSFGGISALDAGYDLSFLWIGLGGALIAELLKAGITGEHLTPGEAFRNILIVGLLAASSSQLAILQVPSSWTQLFMLNRFLAVIAFMAYQVANFRALTDVKKHLKTIPSIVTLIVPYLFGFLLLVLSPMLLSQFVNILTFGIISSWPIISVTLGRVLIVFFFNEIIANAISLSTKNKTLKGIKPNLFIFFVSLGVVIAPTIATIGATAQVGSLNSFLIAVITIVTSMLAFAGLWGEVYLLTGMALDAGFRREPSFESISGHVKIGMKKGIFFSGYFMILLFLLKWLLSSNILTSVASNQPLLFGAFVGTLIFPFLKTIIETFDGSMPFIDRVKHSYKDPSLYGRGAVAGFGFAYAVSQGAVDWNMAKRIKFGAIIGLFASAGISIVRDMIYGFKKQGKIQSWRLYFTDACLGTFIGSALAFYLDAAQVPVIIEKFKLYTNAGFNPQVYEKGIRLFVNKWGYIDLGTFTGGSKLFFTESMAGVLNWAIAAWLFAINKVFLLAIFEKQTAPIKFFFSKAGFAMLVEHMVYVLRWGLWMSPIIFTFLRQMPQPTWYNQDGAIRTIFAIFNGATKSPEAFNIWSLKLFTAIIAYDFLRILVWMDHMGLRVASLVNLSFIGLDRLDEKAAKFIGKATSQRCIPEGVKRFATWAPLLIPFYLPRGKDWDYAWNTSQAMQGAPGMTLMDRIQAMPFSSLILLVVYFILGITAISFIIRTLRSRVKNKVIRSKVIGNREYRVYAKENGEIYSEVDHMKPTVFPREYDVTRRAYDLIDPAGRLLFLVNKGKQADDPKRSWPIVGNFPRDRFDASTIKEEDNSLKIVNNSNGIKSTIDISLPDEDDKVEIWTINIKNTTSQAKELKFVPYVEWLLNGGLHDRFHTQYARLFPEQEYLSGINAVMSWQKTSKSIGILAVDTPPEGFLTTRVDFIGRARSVWKPRVLETLDFLSPKDTSPYPTFDPIGSLMVDAYLSPKASKTIRMMIGYSTNRKDAINLVKKYLRPHISTDRAIPEKKRPFLIGHGEIPPGTPQPYGEFADNGNKFIVHTPYTTRPYDHAMSNIMHSLMVTNRGLHTSCNGNSQQNRLTPDWPDTSTREIPGEAIYLYDIEANEWYSPTHQPLNDAAAKNTCEFSVDGSATFHMHKNDISTELTVFVPPKDPMGVYFLKVKNNSDKDKKIRVAPYFHMVLEFQPEKSGTLQKVHDKETGALYFRNPRNMFRVGWAFVSMTMKADHTETQRGRFFGTDRWVDRPYMVEKGKSDETQLSDTVQIAAFTGTMDIPANSERSVAIVLGQTDTKKESEALVKKYKNVANVKESLEETRKWWTNLVNTTTYKTNDKDFDYLQNWLKYQGLAERVWARRGFYQTSGAFGFRDQLQDTVNLMWIDPRLARKQIILHASHQFQKGDVYHWFFTTTDGRTAFACRSHASDNPLWLAWAVVEYLRGTGDETLLEEMTSYVISEFPFADLPKNKTGWGHLYHRSTRGDTIYKHCLRSIDLVFEKRLGAHGLPLIQTGDWNDGLDEIGSEGKGESVWLAFFLYYILKDMVHYIGKKEGQARKEHYLKKLRKLGLAIEATWREDRYLRAIHDDGTEIGVKDSGIWEIDALTVAWAITTDLNFERGVKCFHTALEILEKDNAVLLGWPALKEDSKPYLGRSSKYPEGVRENGMYCHGVQWMIRAARVLAEKFEKKGQKEKANEYREIAYRLWRKITPVSHVTPDQIEIYGGQPNKQPADILTNYDRGRMIWNGYTGAAGWLLRQAYEGVIGATLKGNKMVVPDDLDIPRGSLKIESVKRDLSNSPLKDIKPRY